MSPRILPLSQAKARLDASTLGQRPSHVKAMLMLAAGATQREVARALEVDQRTIGRWAEEGDSLELIASARRLLRVSMVEGVRDIAPKLVSRLNELFDTPKGKRQAMDARDIDSVARALGAVEKAASSASGELREGSKGSKVTVEIVYPQWAREPLQVDIVEAEPTIQGMLVPPMSDDDL